MPYAEATAVSVHLPEREYPYYVLVTEGFVVEAQFEGMITEATVKAGIYGFTNKENRDKFVSQANRSSELEIAFIAVV
jgi:hypothetical protein